MKNKASKIKLSEDKTEKKRIDDPKGYPLYPESEDIYENLQQEEDINPEDVSKQKASNSTNAFRRKELDNLYNAEDLDVPGSELDDAQEAIGSEDEENNYYSLGGDDHDDLEEDGG